MHPCRARSLRIRNLTQKNASRRLFLEHLERRELLASVATNLHDYRPGDTAIITARDFQVGEAVRFQVLHNDGTPNTGNGHDPWTVIDGSAADLDGLVNGNIGTSWYVDPDDSLNSSFTLTALGLSSSLSASTTFTDANPSATLTQCANDPAPSPSTDGCNVSATQWDSGNLGASKSSYFEGDSIPYRIEMDNLTLASHTVIIEWDTTKGGTHAIDFLTTVNQTVATANPCLGVAGCNPLVFNTFPIPADPQVTGAGVTPIAGNFRIYGGVITGVSAYSYPDGAGFAGDKSAQIAITFTATQVNPVLAWGGHISRRADWGPNGSAVSISGSPFHTRLISLDGSGGNQDRSLSAEAVIFPASITIIKDAVPNSDQNFGFTTTGSLSPATFTLDDDADPTLSNMQVYSGILVTAQNGNDYTISETTVPGWTLSFNTPVCTVTTPNGGSQSGAVPTVSINLREGENVTCTFTNTKDATITIIKDASPDDAQDFAYTTTGTGPAGFTAGFSLDDDADGTLPNSLTFTFTAAQLGNKTVTETLPVVGWSLTNLVCVGGGDNTSTADNVATIGLDAGEAVTCTYVNSLQTGTITVFKDTVPNALQDFSFTRNFGDGFSLDDDAGVTGGNDMLLNTISFSDLEAGTYTITENAQAGYKLTNLVCTGGGDDTSTAGSTATIGLDPGENVICTFTNTLNTIIIPPDKGNRSLPFVHIVDATTGELILRFKAYDENKADAVSYLGGVRVAVGDITGDGIEEIITAPGRNYKPLVRVFTQEGVLLEEFLAYAPTFTGGVEVAVGDFNGDGEQDIVTAMSYNGNQVRVFKNPTGKILGAPTPFNAAYNFGTNAVAATSYASFDPYGAIFKGGATVELASLGVAKNTNGVKQFISNPAQMPYMKPDNRDEIIVGNGSGLRTTVKIYTFYPRYPVSATNPLESTATLLKTLITPNSTYKGGVTLDTARINADVIPDIIVANGNGGGSLVQVFNGNIGTVTGATAVQANILSTFNAFGPGDGVSHNAPVHVAAVDENGDGIAEFILAAQGTDGATRKIRKFTALNPTLVDEFLETHPDFGGAYFLETFKTTP